MIESAPLINWGKTYFFPPGISYILADESNDERNGSWLSSRYFVLLIKGMVVMKQEVINTQRKDQTCICNLSPKIPMLIGEAMRASFKRNLLWWKVVYTILI